MFRLWCSVLVGVSGLDAFRFVSAAMYQLRFFMSICASHLAGCTYQLFDSLGMLISLRHCCSSHYRWCRGHYRLH